MYKRQLDSLRSGVDIVTYSGDKLLGGPQAGLISGGSELIARLRSNSLFRALRVDKLVYAALEATLLAYIRRDHDAIPTLRMMRLSKEAIGERAEALAARVAGPKLKVEIVDGESILGGGAAPSSVLPTRLLALSCEDLSADELAARLRSSEPPIIARVEEGRVLLDLRTVFPEQGAAVERALAALDVYKRQEPGRPGSTPSTRCSRPRGSTSASTSSTASPRRTGSCAAAWRPITRRSSP